MKVKKEKMRGEEEGGARLLHPPQLALTRDSQDTKKGNSLEGEERNKLSREFSQSLGKREFVKAIKSHVIHATWEHSNCTHESSYTKHPTNRFLINST